jgi:hypothetical protein
MELIIWTTVAVAVGFGVTDVFRRLPRATAVIRYRS